MIINKQTKGYQTRSDKPNENWLDESYYLVEDGSELARKIEANYPYFDIVDKNGQLIDVVLTVKPVDISAEISFLKTQLTATDYKIIKCYEYSLVDLPAPYDITALHAERQALRDQINILEAEA
jgi:hypothetical protein